MFSVAGPVLCFHVTSVRMRKRARCIFYESDGKCSKLRMYWLLFKSLKGSLKYNTASSKAFSVAGPVLRNFPLGVPMFINAPRVLHFNAIHYDCGGSATFWLWSTSTVASTCSLFELLINAVKWDATTVKLHLVCIQSQFIMISRYMVCSIVIAILT